jgi:hypothetical protein
MIYPIVFILEANCEWAKNRSTLLFAKFMVYYCLDMTFNMQRKMFMTILEVALRLDLTALVEPEDPGQNVTGCYVGDLLSWVMARAPEGCAWITVMGNLNAIAVAKLMDISMIILCEDSAFDDDARTQAGQRGMAVYSSPQTAYELAVGFSALPGA